MKNVAVSLMAIFFAACSGNKSPHSLQQEKEDLSAKGLLQGIWLDDETESPLMRVEGDTIYYADVQSTPIAFKIIRVLSMSLTVFLESQIDKTSYLMSIYTS